MCCRYLSGGAVVCLPQFITFSRNSCTFLHKQIGGAASWLRWVLTFSINPCTFLHEQLWGAAVWLPQFLTFSINPWRFLHEQIVGAALWLPWFITFSCGIQIRFIAKDDGKMLSSSYHYKSTRLLLLCSLFTRVNLSRIWTVCPYCTVWKEFKRIYAAL